MKKELAHHIAYETFRASSMLNNMIPILKQHCDDEEYQLVARKLSRISADMAIELLNYIFKEYPEIKEEIDNKIKEYKTLIL